MNWNWMFTCQGNLFVHFYRSCLLEFDHISQNCNLDVSDKWIERECKPIATIQNEPATSCVIKSNYIFLMKFANFQMLDFFYFKKVSYYSCFANFNGARPNVIFCFKFPSSLLSSNISMPDDQTTMHNLNKNF